MIKKASIFFLFTLTSCGVFKSNIPQPKTEFRGVWIATVVNIDWPENGSDSWEKQKADYLQILKFYEELNFNAVIVQIRTAGDAFYPSTLAPWSRFLTGTEGSAPKTQDNPLVWLIEQAHNRGFEFHAWINPYRATFDLKTEILSPQHDYNLHPDWMVKYGKKHYYNPGMPEVQEHLVSIVHEIVTQYEVDAIHFDDYFYPYKIKDEVFNDSLAYESHALPRQSLEDWRRSNVDALVNKVHHVIKDNKPWVQFGISPFGVWKNKATDPKGSDTRAGQTTYEDLFADPLKWMDEAWIDYLVPQVYWSMDLPAASHRKILSWWAKEVHSTKLYIGNGAYKIRNNSDSSWENKKELPKQLLLARKTPKVEGNVFFSARSLRHNNKDVLTYLKKNYYKYPAFPPIAPYNKNYNSIIPELVGIHEKENFFEFSFNLSGDDDYRFAIIYKSKKKGQPANPKMKFMLEKVYVGGKTKFTLGKGLIHNRKHLAITFLDKFGKESQPIIIHLNKIEQYGAKE